MTQGRTPASARVKGARPEASLERAHAPERRQPAAERILLQIGEAVARPDRASDPDQVVEPVSVRVDARELEQRELRERIAHPHLDPVGRAQRLLDAGLEPEGLARRRDHARE
ncbi:MAG: hypothetical protein K8H88_23315, partial [Sandaracinaceae bacterium]|nr:hypothetical protein [Sandaracinaceae bacterium]